MPDRDAWLAWRRAGVGGSDIAAICGLSTFASPLSVWADKTGRVEPTATTDRQRIGQVLEGALAQLFHERTGLHVVGEQTIIWSQHPSGSFIAWSPDGERLAEVIFSPRIHRPFTLMEILTDFICADQGQVSE